MGEAKTWRKKVSTLLHRMFELQYGGATSTKFRWMQGYTDGYIQALIDMGFMKEDSMLEVIQTERAAYLDGDKTSAFDKAA
jgi:serine protease inhibitor